MPPDSGMTKWSGRRGMREIGVWVMISSNEVYKIIKLIIKLPFILLCGLIISLIHIHQNV